jgi:hypothetical protein
MGHRVSEVHRGVGEIVTELEEGLVSVDDVPCLLAVLFAAWTNRFIHWNPTEVMTLIDVSGGCHQWVVHDCG